MNPFAPLKVANNNTKALPRIMVLSISEDDCGLALRLGMWDDDDSFVPRQFLASLRSVLQSTRFVGAWQPRVRSCSPCRHEAEGESTKSELIIRISIAHAPLARRQIHATARRRDNGKTGTTGTLGTYQVAGGGPSQSTGLSPAPNRLRPTPPSSLPKHIARDRPQYR